LPEINAAQLLRVGNKADLLDDPPAAQYDLLISTRTGVGIEELLAEISRRVEQQVGHGQSLPFRQRHVSLLRECESALRRAATGDFELELVAEEFRYAASCIGRITGTVD